MHLLHVISTVSPASGGPTEVVRMLVELAPEGVTSEVVTVDDPGSPFLASFPCPVTALGPNKTPLQYSARLQPWLRENHARFDGVIVHGLWNHITFATWRALSGTKTPYAVYPHGMLDPYFKRRFPLKHARNWLWWLASDYHALKHARRVIFTTEAEEQLAQESFALRSWKPQVISLGTTQQLEPTPADLAGFNAVCPQVAGKRFVLFLGRLHPKKGCDMLIEAFVRAAALAPDVHLVVAGPDPMGWQPQLEAIAARAALSDHVHFPGMLTGSPKQAAFATCEAFILPSHQENFGIAVAEALAAARPVLLSDQINIAPEIAADGAGLMEPDTLEGTLALLTRWFDLLPHERQQMSAQAYETFRTRYDMRENAASVARIFSTL